MSTLFTFEAVKNAVRSVFLNARDDDGSIYTSSSNQQIHIGCGTDSSIPSSMVITSSNVLINTKTNVANHIIPTSNMQFDLGTSNLRFRDLYLSGNTINLAGTTIGLDSSNNVRIADATGNNLRRLVVNEIQLGEATPSVPAVRLKKDPATGNFKLFNVTNAGDETQSAATLGSSGSTLSNAQRVTSVTPFQTTIPTVTTKFFPTSANIAYGRIELGTHNGISLSNNTTITLTVTHSIQDSNYIVFPTPDDPTALQVKCFNTLPDSFDMQIKNISGSTLVSPAVNYQLVQSPSMTTLTNPIASPVTIDTTDATYRVYSGPTSTSSIFTLPQLASDPQNYPITYQVLYDSTQRTQFNSNISTLTYTHAKQSAMGAIKIKARNPYIDDDTKAVTYTITETRINPPFPSLPATPVAIKRYTMTSNLMQSYTLSNQDQGLPVTYTLQTTDLDNSTINPTNNTLNWTSTGSNLTKTATLTANFDTPIMTEANLTPTSISYAITEVAKYTTKLQGNMNNNDFQWVQGSFAYPTYIISNTGKLYGISGSTPTEVLPASGLGNEKTITCIASGGTNSCFLDSDGQVYSWGQGGAVGNNTTTSVLSANSAVNLCTNSNTSLYNRTVRSIACGQHLGMALDTLNMIHIWGNGNVGQLGLGNTTTKFATQNLTSLNPGSMSGKTINAVICGNNHVLALDTDKKLHAWGGNANGQLGNGLNSNISTSVYISNNGSLSNQNVIAMSAGNQFSVALDENGQVHAWGSNAAGQLGDLTTIKSLLPKNISIISALSNKTITRIVCGTMHTLALDSDGQVWAWGGNISGQIGNNSTSNIDTPTNISQYGALQNVKVIAIASGANHSIALSEDYEVYMWGNNSVGQFGYVTTQGVTGSIVPIKTSMQPVAL